MKIENLSKKKYKILWIGPYIPSKYSVNWPASSPAASKWQKHLVQGLIKSKCDLEWIYYRPDSYWPKGRLFPSKEIISSYTNFKTTQVEYFNFFGFRNFTKKFFLKKILNNKKKISNNLKQLILITYNAPKWINEIFLDKKISEDFFQIYLLADDKEPNIGDGYVFLSNHNYKKCKHNKKLHLDGGIYPRIDKLNLQKSIKKNKKTIFLYSGSMHKWGGVETLLKSLKLIKNNNFELWISGPGEATTIKMASLSDKRIKFYGLLPDHKLNRLYQKASVFLNPRPIKMQGNEYNFPSKLFDYLAWKKPIISTWTKSLTADYKNILHITKDSPEDFATAMLLYINKKQKKYKVNKNFKKKKNWENQAQRLVLFLNRIIKI